MELACSPAAMRPAVCDIREQERADVVGNGAELREIDGPRIRGSSQTISFGYWRASARACS
jgi:hypothetical protein